MSEHRLEAPDIHGGHVPMRDWSRDEVDFCIVGAGAAGGVLAAKLAEQGCTVALLEAGPHWDPTRDFVSDESGSRQLFWNDERITGGQDPVELGSNNSGRGVGGSTVHYSMIAMRAHPDDFRRRTLGHDLPGADVRDWPITFDELEPYYEEVERDLQIAGPTFYPWGRRRRRYPQREHELNASARVLVFGCTALGIPAAPAPVATLSAPHGDRPPCVYRGFCNYGCTTNAKSSILVTYIPRAIAAGAEVRSECMVVQIPHDARGRATGVLYFRGSDTATLHRQRARHVIVCGYAIETPRLLLNSASSSFPDGLANSSGLVGKCFMVHSGHQVFARFDERISQYKAPPGLALTEHFNRTRPGSPFVCGYTIEAVGPHPADFAARLTTARGAWGAELRSLMMSYNFWSGIGMVGEVLPQRGNDVRLHPAERDRFGVPVPHVRFTYHENDRRLISDAIDRMSEIMDSAGGTDIWSADRTAHLLGTCRMGLRPDESVVDAGCRTHDVPNLFICDGSVFPTSTGVNPSLTIQALAARTADGIGRSSRRR